jgi:hypothetical protein
MKRLIRILLLENCQAAAWAGARGVRNFWAQTGYAATPARWSALHVRREGPYGAEFASKEAAVGVFTGRLHLADQFRPSELMGMRLSANTGKKGGTVMSRSSIGGKSEFVTC